MEKLSWSRAWRQSSGPHSPKDRLWLFIKGFARKIGLSFQAQDDWLGIWGDAQKMGKAAGAVGAYPDEAEAERKKGGVRQ